MKTFPDDVKRSIAEAQNNYCKNCLNPIHSIHHKLPANVPNCAKFKLFVSSPMNGVGLCFSCHSNKAHKYKITEAEAIIFENYLQALQNDLPFTTSI